MRNPLREAFEPGTGVSSVGPGIGEINGNAFIDINVDHGALYLTKTAPAPNVVAPLAKHPNAPYRPELQPTVMGPTYFLGATPGSGQ